MEENKDLYKYLYTFFFLLGLYSIQLRILSWLCFIHNHFAFSLDISHIYFRYATLPSHKFFYIKSKVKSLI